MSVAPSSDSHPDSWLHWFQSRKSAEVINKSHLEKLFETFNYALTEPECILALSEHPESTFLHKANFGSGKVVIFHHLISAGGSFYDSETSKDYGFVHGVEKSTSTSMTPDISILCKPPPGPAISTPTATQLLALSTEETIDDLTASSSVTYRARNFIPIPPFLLGPIRKSFALSNGSARAVLLKCIEAIKEFDTAHGSDDTYKEKAKSKCKDILFWLYLVSQDNDGIEPVPTMAVVNDKIFSRLDDIVNKELSVVSSSTTAPSSSIATHIESSLKRPFEVLAASSSSNSEFIEKLVQLQHSNQEKTQKSFKKIPSKYQNMILVASSVGEVTELEYTAEAVEFFKSSNTLHAQVLLNSQFEIDGIEVSASAAFATTLLYGGFLWKNDLSPSGFAASVLTSEGLMRTDTLHEGMVLDYSTKFDISNASLNKLTKTQVLFPTEIEDMIHRIKGLYTLAKFFFKKNGYLSQGLKRVVNFCSDHKRLLRTRIYMDKKFIAKFICAIDERIYLWLKDCSNSKIVIDTDLSLIDFSSLLSDIQVNRFYYNLPPSILDLVQEHPPKKGRKESNNGGEAVRNTNQNAAWKLRSNERWDNIFRLKTLDGPTLSFGCKPCLKYHVKGICYKDCRQVASHCTLTNEADISKMSQFVKSLRGE